MTGGQYSESESNKFSPHFSVVQIKFLTARAKAIATTTGYIYLSMYDYEASSLPVNLEHLCLI